MGEESCSGKLGSKMEERENKGGSKMGNILWISEECEKSFTRWDIGAYGDEGETWSGAEESEREEGCLN